MERAAIPAPAHLLAMSENGAVGSTICQAPSRCPQPALLPGQIIAAVQPRYFAPALDLERFGKCGFGDGVTRALTGEDCYWRNPPRKKVGSVTLDAKHRTAAVNLSILRRQRCQWQDQTNTILKAVKPGLRRLRRASIDINNIGRRKPDR